MADRRQDQPSNVDDIVRVLNAENGCWMLREMRRQFLEERDRTSAATDPIQQSRAWIAACAAASTYDQKIDEVIPALRDGVTEMERRLITEARPAPLNVMIAVRATVIMNIVADA